MNPITPVALAMTCLHVTPVSFQDDGFVNKNRGGPNVVIEFRNCMTTSSILPGCAPSPAGAGQIFRDRAGPRKDGATRRANLRSPDRLPHRRARPPAGTHSAQ